MTILTHREMYEAFENAEYESLDDTVGMVAESENYSEEEYLTEEDVLIDIYNVLVENYEFESEDEVFATIELLEDESLDELIGFIYEGYEPSEYFFEDLAESYEATEEYLLNEGVLGRLGYSSKKAGKRVNEFLKNTERRGLKGNLKLAGRRLKRLNPFSSKFDAIQNAELRASDDKKFEDALGPGSTPEKREERKRKNRARRIGALKADLTRAKNGYN